MSKALLLRGSASFLFFASVLVLGACETASPVGPCAAANPPPGCGAPCVDNDSCQTGLYCRDGACTADCVMSAECPAFLFCGERGQCTSESDSGVASDSGEGDACATIAVEASPATPNVTLIVDRSGSMRRTFADGPDSFWDRLKDVLINDSTGFVSNLETRVRFGLTMFSATLENPEVFGSPVSEPCPLLEVSAGELVAPDINNADAIRSVYGPADFVQNGLTPTPETVVAMTDRVMANPSDFPEFFIIATDGTPTTCSPPDTTTEAEAADATVAAIARAFDNNVQTFLIFVGPLNDETVRGNMQRFANAGVGISESEDAEAPFFIAEDTASLETALTTITNPQLSCELSLNGQLTNLSEACRGSVSLNGQPLTCNGPDGWRVIDNTRIELVGAACDTYRAVLRSTIDARFPCNVLLI